MGRRPRRSQANPGPPPDQTHAAARRERDGEHGVHPAVLRAEEGQAAPAEGNEGASIKSVEAEGDVVILEKDQIATGDKGVYEAATDIMTLTGNVALSKGQNVTKGQKLVYNLGTGIAVVDAGGTGRVTSTFVSGDAKKPTPPVKTPKP